MIAAVIAIVILIYISGLAMCKAAGKDKWIYERNEKLKEYTKYHGKDLEL